jgi:putative DNA primase/helicase
VGVGGDPVTNPINGPMRVKKFEIPKSDDDYAQQFLEAYRDRVRFCPDTEGWLHYRSECGWANDKTNATYNHLLEFARRLYETGLDEAKHTEDQKLFLKELSKIKDKRRLDPALALSSKDPSIIVRALELDHQPHLIGCANGILNVVNGQFETFNPESLITRRINVRFDRNAEAPTWDRFIEKVQPDPQMRSFLQRLIGSALFGAVRDHFLPFHYGTGANGKSTALEGILQLFGDYGAKLTDSLVYKNRNGSQPHLELAGLFGARLTLGEENAAGGQLNEALLKAITGGDRVKGRFHYSEFVEAAPTYKVHLVGNHKPAIAGTDEGIWRRFLLIPWPVLIPPEERDPKLRERIAFESAGVLNWLLEGCIQWDKIGLQIPDLCKGATADFRQESDDLADFIAEHLEKDLEGYCLKSEVYESYKRWSDTNRIKPMTKRLLGSALQERGFKAGRTSTATRDRSWTGWRLKQ